MALAQLKILYQNHGLRGTWSASSAVGTLPASNLANANRQRVWRSTGITAEWIKVNLGSAKSIAALALVSSNLRASATITIKANSSDAWGSPPFSQVLTPWDASATGVLIAFLSSAQTYQWWRVDLADAGHPDGYLQVGVCALGPVLDLLVAPNDMTFELVDPSPVDYAPSGTPKVYNLSSFVELTMPYALLTQAQAFTDVLTALRAVGRKEDGALSLFATAPSQDDLAKTTNLYGRFRDLPALAFRRDSVNRYDWSVVWRESL